MNIEPYSKKSIQHILTTENLIFTAPQNPSERLAELCATNAAIVLVQEGRRHIIRQVDKTSNDQRPIDSEYNDLIHSIYQHYAVRSKSNDSSLDIREKPFLCFLEDTLYNFFDSKLDFLYFSSTNTLIAFKENPLAAYRFSQKKIKQLESQCSMLIENSRRLQAAVFSYRMAFAIPGFSLLGRLVKIIQPRLGTLYQYNPRTMAVPGGFRPINLLNPPKISIVTPSFEQGKYIERTIQSVLHQKYPNLEYFIKDGGSQDNTPIILKHYENELSGWVSKSDRGQAHAINEGFAKTTGDIMAWINSDDILLPGTLTYVADYFNKHPEIDVLYGNRLLIDENDMEIGRWILPGHNNRILSWVDYIPQETIFWRRRLWEKIGGQVDETFNFAMDWDLLLRFREAKAKFAHIPYFIGGFRVHELQKTLALADESGLTETERIHKRTLGRIPTNMEVHSAVFPFVARHTMADISYRLTRRLTRKQRSCIYQT